jgi:hypothetical protein
MDIRAITLGIASNGTVTLIDSTNAPKVQQDTVRDSTTLGNTYASCEVWDRSLGLICKRVFGDPSVKGANITIKPKDEEIFYKGSAPTYSLEGIGLFANDSVASVTKGTAVFTVKDNSNNTVTVNTASPGTYKITVSGISLADGKQYDLTVATGTLTIKKVPLKVTAADKTIKEFGSAPEYTATITGFVSGETSSNLSGSLAYDIKDGEGNTVANVSTAAPGVYSIVPKGLTSNNYDIEFVPGKLTIEALPDITITAADKTMTAGGSEPEYTATATGDFADGEDISDLTGTLSYTITDGNGETVADVTAAEAGTYSIVPSGLSSDDYDVHFVAGTLTIEAGS